MERDDCLCENVDLIPGRENAFSRLVQRVLVASFKKVGSSQAPEDRAGTHRVPHYGSSPDIPGVR